MNLRFFKEHKLVLGSVVILLLGITISLSQVVVNLKTKTAYVDVNELYEHFTMKKELETKLNAFQAETRYLLDSINTKINALAISIEDQKDVIRLERLRNEYLLKEKRIQEDELNIITQYDEQIWNQLNQYVNEFSLENGYDYLIGSNGTGTIMGGNPKLNITDQVLVYVNHRYHGN